eukprot:SAG31_NODE_3576_length_4107_cov_4.203593_4_plen_94_part_00
MVENILRVCHIQDDFCGSSKLPGIPGSSFSGDQHGDKTETPYAALRSGDWKLLVGNPGGGPVANGLFSFLLTNHTNLLLLRFMTILLRQFPFS